MQQVATPSTAKRATGRPPKFDEPRRPVTVTLPERTLRLLEGVDKDRARAIAKVTEHTAGVPPAGTPLVEFVEIAAGKALIVVGPCASLSHVAWLRLARIAPGRFVLTIPSGTAVETLEVALLDLMDSLAPDEEVDRPTLKELCRVIGLHRRRAGVSKAEILLFEV